MKKSLILLVLMIVLVTTNVLAVEGVSTQNQTQRKVFSDNETMIGDHDTGLPNASMDDAGEWIDKKGNDVIGLLQKISQSFMIILFVIGAILAAAGGRKTRPTGISMMILSMVCQGFIMYAPEIMDFVQNWIAS